MKYETLRSRAGVGCFASVVACLIAGGGCRPTPSGSAEPGVAGDGGASEDGAGAPHGAGRDGMGAGGASPVGNGEDGGTNGELGEGAAGTGGSSGEADSSADDELRSEIEICLAELVGPAADDIVSARGRAGALGAVDYTIAGYSAGAHGPDGLQRATNSTSGQRGTPAGISDTGLWLWTQNGPVVVGTVYGSDESGGAQVEFRVIADDYTTAVSCPEPQSGSGRFVFTQFDPSLGGLEDNGVRATGGYSYQCLEADIDVRGCFRYMK